jgi:hypothetical protein
MKILIMGMVSCTYSVLAFGQCYKGSDGQSVPSGGDAQETSKHHVITTKGCLLGQNGKYILITSKQSGVMKLVATPNLEGHVGHKVKITGTVEDLPVPQSAVTASLAETDDTHTSTSADVATTSGQMRVIKIKTLSATCDAKADKAKKSWMRILSL